MLVFRTLIEYVTMVTDFDKDDLVERPLLLLTFPISNVSELQEIIIE